MITDPTFVKLENAVTDEQGYTFPAGTFYGEMVQHYCDLLCAGINVSDGVNGWYDPDAAKADLKAAKEELDEVVSWPIQIDLVYFAQSDAQRDQAEAYKTSIETVLGAENVVVNLIAAENSADYYACGYLAASGAAGNYDLFYGSGWGPDFGDPSTYLNSFDRAVDGYMLRIMGLF
jgi:ABC-type oligopeptide transport system substrate-binding subunit